ncbi:MAG TPA: ATP synthase subunit I [Candidatus Dormibacteraeota bacterium]|nr:ATP synthase subunit I [Candidatus Dormibacteraeota bacterium]
MKRSPLLSIPLMMSGLAALTALTAAAVFASNGRPDWSLGVIAGWLAGSLNTALLALRVSRLTARSSVAGFLYGAASRFTLVGLIAIGGYRLVGANPLGFAIGIAMVILMGVPVTVAWSLKREAAA